MSTWEAFATIRSVEVTIFKVVAQCTNVVQNSRSIDNFHAVLVRESQAMYKTSEYVFSSPVYLLNKKSS